MDRKRIIVAACMILAAVFIIALTWKTGNANSGGIPSPSGNQAQVVTQGGTVTLVPKGNPYVTFVATLPATNSQSKTSSPAPVPKGK